MISGRDKRALRTRLSALRITIRSADKPLMMEVYNA